MDKQSTSQLERERVRLEIAQLTEEFLRKGGNIRQVKDPRKPETRVVGRAWSSELFQ